MGKMIMGIFILLLGIMLLSGVSCRPGTPPVKEVGPPTIAFPLEPVDRAMGVPLNPTLTWMAAKRATSYDICFGTTNPPPFRSNAASTSCNPGTLEPLTTYYWRIDAVNEHGKKQGDIRIFTTSR